MNQSYISAVVLMAVALTASVAFAASPAKLSSISKEEITTVPGIENTKICGSDVLRIATARATKERIKLGDFRVPVIALKQKNGKIEWFVYWQYKEPTPGGFFTIVVDDDTGATRLIEGM